MWVYIVTGLQSFIFFKQGRVDSYFQVILTQTKQDDLNSHQDSLQGWSDIGRHISAL